MSNFNIWIVNNFEPFSKNGYKKWRYGYLADHLREIGISSLRFKSDWDHFNKNRVYSDERNNIVYKSYGYSKNRSISRIIHHRLEPYSLNLEFEKRKPPNLILTSIPTIEIAWLVRNYSLKHNIPYIVDIRDLWPDQYLNIMGSKLSFLIKPYYKYLLRKVSKILIDSESVTCISLSYKHWIKKNFNISDSHVFPIGIDCNKLRSNIYNNQRDLQSKVNLLFVGSLTKAFDFNSIFQFLKSNEQFTLRICGTGPTFDTLKRTNVKNVFFKGWLNGKQLLKEFEKADYGITPYASKSTISLPNKPYEYLAKGLPIINSLGGELANLINDKCLGYNYCNYEDLLTLKPKISNEQNYLHIVQNIQTFIENGSYTVDKIYSRFAGLINNSLNKKKVKKT